MHGVCSEYGGVISGSIKGDNFSTRLVTANFPRKTMHHGVTFIYSFFNNL
jgi:hypothetical protein